MFYYTSIGMTSFHVFMLFRENWRYFDARLCEQLSRGMSVFTGIRPNQQTGTVPHVMGTE